VEKNAANGSFLNNLFYNDVNPPGTKRGYYLWASACLPVNSGHNLAFDSSCTAGTLAGCTTGQMATDSGNIYADPKLVATDGSSFDLQPGSPALNAGAFDNGCLWGFRQWYILCKGCQPFQDHFGISGVNADCISSRRPGITSASQRSTTYKYADLANSVTRSSGDPVLFYSIQRGESCLSGVPPMERASSTFRLRSVGAEASQAQVRRCRRPAAVVQ
jgi:hypothetical protein